MRCNTHVTYHVMYYHTYILIFRSAIMWCHTHLVMNVCDIFVFSSNKTCFRISLALNPLGWGFVVHVALVQKYTKCETVSAYLFKVFRRDTGMNTFALILFSASLFACCLTRLLPGRPHNVSARSKIWITSWMNGFESWPLQKSLLFLTLLLVLGKTRMSWVGLNDFRGGFLT